VEVVFQDGTRFVPAGESDVGLMVTAASAAPATGDPTHYLRGVLHGRLVAASGEVVELHLQID
jgi:hypothetical protein